jgi:hypothetical protein
MTFARSKVKEGLCLKKTNNGFFRVISKLLFNPSSDKLALLKAV